MPNQDTKSFVGYILREIMTEKEYNSLCDKYDKRVNTRRFERQKKRIEKWKKTVEKMGYKVTISKN